jgi:hypothetical protein
VRRVHTIFHSLTTRMNFSSVVVIDLVVKCIPMTSSFIVYRLESWMEEKIIDLSLSFVFTWPLFKMQTKRKREEHVINIWWELVARAPFICSNGLLRVLTYLYHFFFFYSFYHLSSLHDKQKTVNAIRREETRETNDDTQYVSSIGLKQEKR